MEPDTLLLDEPLSNLDANLREEMRFEVRRLHDAYRYTTIYVTHDQSEAMTTADLIAVMNAGRIEQLGTPAGGLRAPRSEFVGALPGRQQHPARQGARCDAYRVRRHDDRCGAAPAGARRGRSRVGPPARHRSSRTAPAAAGGNAVQGTVVRNVFLGNTRDYIVEAKDGTQLRITAPPESNFAPGHRGVADAAAAIAAARWWAERRRRVEELGPCLDGNVTRRRVLRGARRQPRSRSPLFGGPHLPPRRRRAR